MDTTAILNVFSSLSKHVFGWLLLLLNNIGVPQMLATRISPLLYWLVIALLIWLTISLLSKINTIVKVFIFILLGLLALGFFVPVW